MNMEFFFPIPQSFNKEYVCYSMNFYKNCTDTMQNGGKILLPNSALDLLTRLHIQYPMLFKLTNETGKRSTHCGVLEFSAEEGTIHVPYWMMVNLGIQEGNRIQVRNVALEIASYARFQPLTQDFLDISNPKAVLENALRDFACLTTGDHLAIKYNNKIYELKVLETKPENAVSIIECDMRVDFAPPMIGDVEETAVTGGARAGPSNEQNSDNEDEYSCDNITEDDQKFKVFGGSGRRLDGKIRDTTIQDFVPSTVVSGDRSSDVQKRGVPNYNYRPGMLTFCRSKATTNQGDNKEPTADPVLFPGEGYVLRRKSIPASFE